MNLEKQKAIQNHRTMWIWIARESIKRKYAVSKWMYFQETKIKSSVNCFCCDYVWKHYKDASPMSECENVCPVIWGTPGGCIGTSEQSLFDKWCDCTDKEYIKAAFLAYKISQLPARK